MQAKHHLRLFSENGPLAEQSNTATTCIHLEKKSVEIYCNLPKCFFFSGNKGGKRVKKDRGKKKVKKESRINGCGEGGEAVLPAHDPFTTPQNPNHSCTAISTHADAWAVVATNLSRCLLCSESANQVRSCWKPAISTSWEREYLQALVDRSDDLPFSWLGSWVSAFIWLKGPASAKFSGKLYFLRHHCPANNWAGAGAPSPLCHKNTWLMWGADLGNPKSYIGDKPKLTLVRLFLVRALICVTPLYERSPSIPEIEKETGIHHKKTPFLSVLLTKQTQAHFQV